MRGTIDKVWENEHKGKPWKKLVIDGEDYSLWEKDWFDLAQEDACVEFEFRKKGDFNTITALEVVTPAATSGGNGGTSDKQIQISRLSCLKTAVELLPEGTSLNSVIRTAMRMEEYVVGEIDPGELEEPSNPFDMKLSPVTPTDDPPADQETGIPLLPSLKTQREKTRRLILEMCDNDADAASNYLFGKVKQHKFKDVTTTEFADLKVAVEEDHAIWMEEQGGPFDPVEE